MSTETVAPDCKSARSVNEKAREIQVQFGRRILRLRQAKGWSRRELARRLGVSQERLGYWERGEHAPSLAALAALREALGVPIDELVIGDRAPAAAGLSRERRLAALSHLAAVMKLVG